MKTIGEKIFAKDADGNLISRIGTMFFRTPGLVTKRGVHALQRVMWFDAINAERAAAGQLPMTIEEEEAETVESVDLIFTEDEVRIRPNPDRMDLAFRADEELQKLVSKRVIRFLNTDSAKVRTALRERGENWRMARQPISQEDMAQLVTSSKVALDVLPVYYYNHMTGTRFITASGYAEVEKLPAEAFRRQVAEVVAGLSKRNRLGRPEIDIFPTTTPIGVRNGFRALKVDEMDDAALRAACTRLTLDWRMSLPADLREETVENFAWRNEMCYTLTRQPNETAAEEQELITGISPEFYRQIEWLPGIRVEDDEVVFDEIYDEAARTQDPKLLALCDNRVKSFLFNSIRLFGHISYINIGRISNSLTRHASASNRRGNVYIMQYCERTMDEPRVLMIRLQKWGVAEHLDEGKDLARSIMEADEYSDYVLDRRLMCAQIGMNLPARLGFGRFTEKYRGPNGYNGASIRTAYFVRSYEPGMASDKIPPARFHNPAFAHRFAELMGSAAAVDLVVGRRNATTQELLFDQNYEVVRCGADGLPNEVKVTDHAGSFVDYESDFEKSVAAYANTVLRRKTFVTDYPTFAEAFVNGFETRLADIQATYVARRRIFDNLFVDRPYDTNGSGAYRWACCLKRLAACDPARVAAALRAAAGC